MDYDDGTLRRRYVGLVTGACVEVLELMVGQAIPAAAAVADPVVRAGRMVVIEKAAAASPLGSLLPVLVTALSCFPNPTWLADSVLPHLTRLCQAAERAVRALPSSSALCYALECGRLNAQQRCV